MIAPFVRPVDRAAGSPAWSLRWDCARGLRWCRPARTRPDGRDGCSAL